MDVMTAKLEKDLRNSVNRRLNCDSANLDKAVLAAREQTEAIRKLQAAGILETCRTSSSRRRRCGWKIRS